MIEIKNLRKEFPNVIAVNDLSIEIRPGINGLIGQNGAGKSTLLRLIADVFTPNAGDIYIDGLHNYEPEVKKNLFFLSDNPYYPSNANVKEVVELYSSLFDMDKDKFYLIIDDLGLPKDRRLSTFSKGMRRQLFLALSLSMDAEYILLDEAFDGLDPIIQDVVKEEISKHSKDKTFIISSHNLTSLEKLCDNFILLSKGRFTKGGGMKDLGNNFKKYQIIFTKPVSEEDLRGIGVYPVSYRQVGSINYLVSRGEDDEALIKHYFNPQLIENVAIDNEELIKLEMIVGKGDKK